MVPRTDSTWHERALWNVSLTTLFMQMLTNPPLQDFRHVYGRLHVWLANDQTSNGAWWWKESTRCITHSISP